MSISGIGFNPVHNLSGVGTASSISKAEPSQGSASAAPVSDGVTLGESQPEKPKKGLINWLKDLVKTEVEGPEHPYSERMDEVLGKALAQATPEEKELKPVPDDKAQLSGEPSGFYVSDSRQELSGNSLNVPERLPGMDDVKGYRAISKREAAQYYAQEVKDHLSTAQKSVIKAYSDQAFGIMNNCLIEGEASTASPTVRAAVNVATNALNSFDVPQGTVLMRTASIGELHNYVPEGDYAKYSKMSKHPGKSQKLAQILDMRLQGTQTTRKAFTSTTVDADFKLDSRPKVATKFYVGEGVKGIYISSDPATARFDGESEYLLAPETKATVMHVDYDPKADGLVMHVFLGDLPQE